MSTEFTEVIDRLEKLGLKNAAKLTRQNLDRIAKMSVAYQKYEWITWDDIKKFNEWLNRPTLTDRHLGRSYKMLEFRPLDTWEKVPPTEVLDKLEASLADKCFDSYEVAYIQEVKDPILFGTVNGCGDKFFIAQWENDVTIEEILKVSRKD